MADPWERREGESSKAFAAFCCYRDMGPKRSAPDAYAIYSGRPRGRAGASPPGFFTRWSAKFDWLARAQALDKDLHDQELGFLRKHREDHVIRLWSGMSEAINIQIGRIKEASFDELTRLYTSMRSSLQAFDSERDTDDVPGSVTAARTAPTYSDPWLEDKGEQ